MRRELLLAFSGLLAACAAGAALAGCPSTTTTASYTPVTGILIRSSSLVAGHGCGTAPGQVYRYSAVLTYQAPPPDAGFSVDTSTPVETGVFDCFTDGLFSNLPAAPTNPYYYSFDVKIYAYDKDAFPAALDCPPGGSAMPDGSPCPGDVTSVATAADVEAAATWTTTCTATQQSGVSVLAVCAPLQAPGAGADAGGDAGADSGADADAGAGTDADAGAEAGAGADADAGGGPDAAAEAGGDASPDSSADADAAATD